MRLLRGFGYKNALYFRGGLESWTESGGALVNARSPQMSVQAMFRSQKSQPRWPVSWILAIADRSLGMLLALWFAIIFACGVLYWLAGFWPEQALRIGGAAMDTSVHSLGASVYFSFVTALSIGYGDLTPVGYLRWLAVSEGFAGLFLFSCVVSKLVGQRQEQLMEELHRIAFEDRMGRIRTNLHHVLSDFQNLLEQCSLGTSPKERLASRVESAVAVFAGEVRTVHDLLYRPQQLPEEPLLETLLANLEATLRELVDLLECSGELAKRSASLEVNLQRIANQATEICGECVPKEYTPVLKAWMDRIQALARRLA